VKISLRAALAAVLFSASAFCFAQLGVHGSGANSGQQLAGASNLNGSNGHSGPPPPGQTEFVLQNLIGPATVVDPLTGETLNAYRPMLLNLDKYTIRDVLTANGVDANDPNLIIQLIGMEKKTSIIKCSSPRVGYGAGKDGINNFFKVQKAVHNDSMDKGITYLLFGVHPLAGDPLGDRALLYTTPNTYYQLWVTYVVRLANGRISAPETRTLTWTVKVPMVEDIRNYIDYFRPVAAGLTQKPKITWDVQKKLNSILDDIVDPLATLLDFETVVATSSLDFAILAGADDARFFFSYMIDSPEEPYQCVLIEMANALLFH
jgi:hypothetical protein